MTIFLHWETGDPLTRWEPDILFTEWDVGNSVIGINHLSTEYVLIPVVVTKAGVSYNPTGDPIAFAFMPTATQVPQSGDWVAGAWETDTPNPLYPYTAKCLVGPTGTINLGIGTYIVYIRVTDNPEVPILVAGQLQVS